MKRFFKIGCYLAVCLILAGTGHAREPEKIFYAGLIDHSKVIDIELTVTLNNIIGAYSFDEFKTFNDLKGSVSERQVQLYGMTPEGVYGFVMLGHIRRNGIMDGELFYTAEGNPSHPFIMVAKNRENQLQPQCDLTITPLVWHLDWSRIKTPGTPATIHFFTDAGQSLSFSFQTFSGAGTGCITGVAQKAFPGSLDFVFKDKASGCTIRFIPIKERKLMVLSNSGCYEFGGLGSRWSGLFRPQNTSSDQDLSKTGPSLYDLGILNSKLEDDEFRAITHLDYPLFVRAFQVPFKRVFDLDADTRVVQWTGYVKGLKSLYEAIIIHTESGYFWAALWHNSKFRYFTNVDRDIDSPPDSIEEWKKQLKP